MSKLLHSFNIHATRQPGPLKQSPTMEAVALWAPALLNSREFTTESTLKTQDTLILPFMALLCRLRDPGRSGSKEDTYPNKMRREFSGYPTCIEHPQRCHLAHCCLIITESSLHLILLCLAALTVDWLWNLKQTSMRAACVLFHCITGFPTLYPAKCLRTSSHLLKESPLVFIRCQPSLCGRQATNWVKTQR